jgi:hypothetical protein
VAIHSPDRALAGQIFQKHENKFARTGVLPMTGLATNFVEYFKREAALETLVRITFGTFMGGLVLLLTLLYSGVPIV